MKKRGVNNNIPRRDELAIAIPYTDDMQLSPSAQKARSECFKASSEVSYRGAYFKLRKN